MNKQEIKQAVENAKDFYKSLSTADREAISNGTGLEDLAGPILAETLRHQAVCDFAQDHNSHGRVLLEAARRIEEG